MDVIAGNPLTMPVGMRKWATLPVLSLALAIVIIDSSLLNISLATLIGELHTTLQSLQWVMSGYALVLAALTVTGGRLGDLFGRKRTFRLGALLFAAGSFLASISSSVPMLFAGESVIEGIGAAMMMPAAVALLVTKYRGHDRAIAFGIWGGVVAVASAVGPILGGFLTTHFSWRWGFRINVFVVAILLLGSYVIYDEPVVTRKRLDLPGVGLSALGLFLLVFGIIEAPSHGWLFAFAPFKIAGQPISSCSLSIVPFATLLGVAILGAFLLLERRVERRGGTPIVSSRILGNRGFLAGASLIGLTVLGQAGLILPLLVFVQSVRSLDPLHTGLTLLPLSIVLGVVSPAAAALARTVPHRWLVQCGLIINFIALLITREAVGVQKPLIALVPGLALYGLGMGLVQSQVNNLTLSSVPVADAGEASGIINTFRQIGSALGTAIIGSVLLTAVAMNLQASMDSSRGLPSRMSKRIGIQLHEQSSHLIFGTKHAFEGFPPTERKVLISTLPAATLDASRKAFLYAASFVLFALMASTQLPLWAPVETIKRSGASEPPHLAPRPHLVADGVEMGKSE
jgi:EmrB/QacA subfamily drug resistance transporter